MTGVVVLGTLAAVCWTVWRRQPGLADVLRWLALVLLVANLVNKQAFYNQFWLVGALVVVSLAVADAGTEDAGSGDRVGREERARRRGRARSCAAGRTQLRPVFQPTLANVPEAANPLRHKVFTSEASTESGYGLVHDGPGPPPDISLEHGWV